MIICVIAVTTGCSSPRPIDWHMTQQGILEEGEPAPTYCVWMTPGRYMQILEKKELELLKEKETE